MENLSNNNPHVSLPYSSLRGGGTTKNQSNNNRNSLRLFLLLFHFSFFIFHISFAQNAYNKLYTLQASWGMFNAIAPHGGSGGCIAAAAVIDSLTGKQAIRIVRIDALGNLQASNYFNIPDDTIRTLFVNYKAITRVHDNCYAIAGSVIPSSRQYAFILLADSNGVVYNYKDLIYRDTILDYISDVKYDGLGHIIASGHYYTKLSDSSNAVIYKFDTALNLVWQKQYHPGGILRYSGLFSLVVDGSGYTLAGGGQNGVLNSFKDYKLQSLILKIDTAGTLQWFWASPAVFYKDFQSYIGAVLHTKDGGYLFTTEGHTYNSLYPSDPDFGIRLNSKQVIIKFDAARNKQWEIVVDDYFGAFGYGIRTSLIELEDSSFLFLGSRTTDSLAPNLKTGKLVLQHYSSRGVLLKQRIINKYLPRSVDDTHKESGGPIYDIKQTADKAFVLCGYYENKTTGAAAPAQRGWLLKLDSNLCLGVGDSQCMPSSIIEQPQVSGAEFKVYPNPSNGIFTIVCHPSEGGAGGGLIIYDITGRQLIQQELKEAETKLDMSSYTSGVYLYIIRQGDKTIGNGKLIKQ
jgi:hypothetical protein